MMVYAEFVDDEDTNYPIDLVVNHIKTPLTVSQAKQLIKDLQEAIEVAEARQI